MNKTDYEEWVSDAASATSGASASARTALLGVIAFLLVDILCELREREDD